jgi:hypothetical protein
MDSLRATSASPRSDVDGDFAGGAPEGIDARADTGMTNSDLINVSLEHEKQNQQETKRVSRLSLTR